MKLHELRPGWATELTKWRPSAEIVECDDCIVVRTPGNPSWYWGNCLILAEAPRDEDVGHWLARFAREIGDRQPASRHVAIGVNPPWQGERRPAWQAAGLKPYVNAVMRLVPGELAAPRPVQAHEVVVRPIAWPDEVPAIVELECADTHGHDVAGYRLVRERAFAELARLQAEGRAEWFGLWCDGVLAADCGLLRPEPRPGATARFQRVATHPAWRRRGLARALVHAASRFALERWQAGEVVMIADPGDVAIALYRSLGWREFEREWGFERKAPQDAAP